MAVVKVKHLLQFGEGKPRIRAAALCTVAALFMAGCQPIVTEAPKPTPVEEPQQAGVELPPVAEPAAEVAEQAPLEAVEPLPEAPWRTGIVPPATQAGLVRVGLLLPLTGRAAPVGEALLNAAQMALFDVGAENFVLQSYDTGGTPQGAEQAASRAISEGAKLLLGPLFSASVKAVTVQAQMAGINMIAFSSDPSAAAPGSYVLGFLLEDQVRQVMRRAIAKGVKSFGVLAPYDAYGDAVIEAMQNVALQNNVALSRVSRFDPAMEDISGIVKSLADYEARKRALARQKSALLARGDSVSKAAAARLNRLDTLGDPDFQALMLPVGGARLTQLGSLLPYYDVDPAVVQMMGTMLWADQQNLGTEPGLVGAWYPAPPPATHNHFVQRYQEAFGSMPPTIASLGYDTTALAAVLAQQPDGPAFDAETLTGETGFAGVDGIFRLLPNGFSERGFAVIEVTPRGTVVETPAPQRFDTPPPLPPLEDGGSTQPLPPAS